MIQELFSMEGRVALVTGAGKGIGRAIALALAEAGADVAVLARTQADIDSAAEEIRALGRNAVAIPFDVMETEAIPGVVAEAAETLGGLDVLVNNAGGSFPKPLLDTSHRSFEKSFSFNVSTAFEFTKAAVPHMLATVGGRTAGGDSVARGESAVAGGASRAASSASVVNISSAAGVMPDRGFAAYGTAKAALAYLGREMAQDLAPYIRVNSIAVGSVRTDALETVLTDDDIRSAMEEGTPLRRLGEVTDIAAGALYLASDASSFVTGTVLHIDGGTTNATLKMGIPDYQPE